MPVITSLILTFSAVSLRLLLALLLLKFHIAKVHDGSDYFIAAVFLVGKETEDVHGVLQRGKVDVILRANRLHVLLSHAAEFIFIRKDKNSYISGHELLSVIQVLHGGDTLRAEVEVIRVGGHQQHV